MDLFQKFTCYDGRNRPVTIDSLRKLRQVERESEKLEANGEGASMHWRMYSQNESNRYVNTHGPDPAEAPSPEAVAKFGPGIKRMLDEPDASYGPAVDETNTSALGE